MYSYIPQLNDALIQAPSEDGWLLFRDPVDVLAAYEVADVVPVLQSVDRSLYQTGLFTAGFVSYEAAPGLDPALKTKCSSSFPLVWFGLYQNPVYLRALPDPQPGGSLLPSFHWSPTVTRREYDLAIEQVKKYIARGETYQVNYTYRLISPFQGEPYGTFVDLARAQRAKYTAFVHTDRYTLCSASPELFFSLDGDLLASKPMKGTAARGRTLREDLEQASWLQISEKDRAENVMIVDMVRNDIGKIARTGSVRIPELFAVEKYPTVWQMVSTVTGETGAGLYEIFQALFPPASITGAPKPRTMEIIEKLENTPRRIYTGCIGYASPNRKAQFNVSIRTMLVDRLEMSAEYGIGGGITWGSIDSAEYEESRAKAKILAVRMPRFSLLETLLWEPGKGYFLLEYHLARLRDSAEYFAFQVDIPSIRQYLIDLTGSFNEKPLKVRLLVDEQGQVSSEAEAIPTWDEKQPLRLCLAPAPVDSSNPFLYHKTTHRQIYEQARLACPEEKDQPWDDVILWNEKGEVTEACLANILLERDGVLYTPPVDCGLLAGTYRAWLLDQGKIKERIIRLDELFDFTRVYLINSVRKKREAVVLTAETFSIPG
ncbi:MAG: aminodeoxychorismate synthase component I [Candidatus Methanosuratincola sp.]